MPLGRLTGLRVSNIRDDSRRFFTFWQSIGLTLMTHWGWISEWNDLPVEEVQVGLQNFIICIEMLITAIAHKWVFGHEQYEDGSVTMIMELRAAEYNKPEISYEEQARINKEKEARMSLMLTQDTLVPAPVAAAVAAGTVVRFFVTLSNPYLS